MGAVVSCVPLIRIAEPSDRRALQAAANAADAIDWLLFTSANGVAAFARRRSVPLPPRVRVAVVGPATAAAVQSLLHRPIDVIPERHSSDALASAFLAAAKPGATACVIQPEGEASPLARLLEAAGYAVNAVGAYRTLPTPAADMARKLSSVDAIVLMSGSQARALTLALGAARSAALGCKIVVAIGERTAKEAERLGIRVNAVASDVTPASIARVLARGREG